MRANVTAETEENRGENMKKSKKSFILIGMATVAIGMTAMLQVTKPFNKNVALQETKTYNHRPENILDNVFTEGNTKYLPFIFDKPTDTITKEKITSEFAKAGLTVNEIKTDEELVGTGTQITVKENNTVYNVIVYGDVDGDGYADTMDAYDIILYTKHPTENPITGIYFKAGNVCNFEDDEVDTIDAYQIILFQKGGLNELVEVEPAPDTTKPVITLVGSSSITINVGTTYTDPGAKATNNYGADITSRITTEIKNASGQVVSSINTSSSGKYTITYNVADNNGNTAIPVTRNVEVKANSSGGGGGSSSKPETINSITMKDLPKIEYNYGEKLNLTGATITVDSSKGTRTENITSSMVADKDLSQEGTKTITVTYKGKTTTFDVTVLKKIAGLEFTADENISVVNGNYEVEADPQGSKEVVLGSIKETNQEGGSKLTEEQLNGNIQVELVSSDSEATASDLTVTTKVEDGKILLVAKAKKAGNYTVNASIKYGSDVIALTPAINVRAVKSNKLGSVELEAIEAEEIRIKKPATKTLTIKNINNETISDIVAKNINIKNVTSGVEVIKLNENKKPVEDDERVVSALQISTTSTQSIKNASFTIEVVGKENTVSKEVTFDVGEALVLSDIKLGTSNISLHVEESENTVALNGNIYQVFTIEGLDQLGETMEENINSSDIEVITENPNIDVLENLTPGKIAIILPRGSRKIQRSDGSYRITQGNVLDVVYFDKDGNPVGQDESKEITQIGISLYLNESSFEVVPSSLTGKKVQFALTKEKIQELPITVNYKALKTIDMLSTGKTNNVTVVEEGSNYNATVNLNEEEFTLGTIEPGQYEGPLTSDMLKATITPTGTQGINIKFVEENGSILMKGSVTEEGTYTIRVNAGTIPLKKNISITVEKKVEITNITLSNANVEIGKLTTSDITAISKDNPDGETILLKDLELTYDKNIINVTPIGVGAVQYDDDEVTRLQIEAKGTTDTTTNLTIKIHEKEITIPIEIYNSIPRAIEIAPNVNLYENEVEGKTTTQNGRIYTLLDVKAYADTAKTKPITLTNEMLTRAEEENKICITIPRVVVTTNTTTEPMTTGQRLLVDVQYFGESKTIGTEEEVKYIGFAIVPNMIKLEDEKSKLNGIDITFKCTNNAQISTVTTQYTNTARLPQEGE